MFFSGWEKCLTGIISDCDPTMPRRFSEAQLTYYAEDAGYRIRSFAASGIELRIHTDADALILDAQVEEASSQDLWGFDLLVNGALYAHLDGRTHLQNEIHWQVDLPKGEKRLALCLPCLAGVILKNLMLNGATFAQPDRPSKKLLVCGDSIAQGYVTRFPSLTWPSILARSLDMEFLNQSVAGMTFESDMPVIPTGADLAVIAYGTNDWTCKTAEHFENDARAVIDHVKQTHPQSKIVVFTPIWRADFAEVPAKFAFKQLPEIFQSITQTTGAAILPGNQLFPAIPQFLQDGVHPNEQGHMIYGQRAAELFKAFRS